MIKSLLFSHAKPSSWQEYAALFRHIVAFMREHNVDSVARMWAPGAAKPVLSLRGYLRACDLRRLLLTSVPLSIGDLTTHEYAVLFMFAFGCERGGGVDVRSNAVVVVERNVDDDAIVGAFDVLVEALLEQYPQQATRSGGGDNNNNVSFESIQRRFDWGVMMFVALARGNSDSADNATLHERARLGAALDRHGTYGALFDRLPAESKAVLVRAARALFDEHQLLLVRHVNGDAGLLSTAARCRAQRQLLREAHARIRQRGHELLTSAVANRQVSHATLDQAALQLQRYATRVATVLDWCEVVDAFAGAAGEGALRWCAAAATAATTTTCAGWRLLDADADDERLSTYLTQLCAVVVVDWRRLPAASTSSVVVDSAAVEFDVECFACKFDGAMLLGRWPRARVQIGLRTTPGSALSSPALATLLARARNAAAAAATDDDDEHFMRLLLVLSLYRLTADRRVVLSSATLEARLAPLVAMSADELLSTSHCLLKQFNIYSPIEVLFFLLASFFDKCVQQQEDDDPFVSEEVEASTALLKLCGQ